MLAERKLQNRPLQGLDSVCGIAGADNVEEIANSTLTGKFEESRSG